MKNSLSWARALQEPGVRLTAEERAAGWPEALTPENLACLQCPMQGSAEENAKLDRERRAMGHAIWEAMKAGSLPYIERTFTVEDYKVVPCEFVEPSLIRFNRWLDPENPPTKRVKAGEHVVTERVINAGAFGAWLLECKEEPSEHVRAWFSARLAEKTEAEGGQLGGLKATKARRETRAGRVEHWLHECERRAKEAGETFDRQAMPGTKAEFLTLLKALDPDFSDTNTVPSLERYLTGLCAFKGGRPPSAIPLYRRLFEEAHIQDPGAVSQLRKKA